MKTIELLAYLKAKGARMTASQGKLKFSAPAGLITPELSATLGRNKAEIISLLEHREEGFSFFNDIVLGDSGHELKTIPSDSIDLMVTDPPYGIGFMGRNWDKATPSVETWKECLRVLKPGALAFVMCTPRQDSLCKMISNLMEAGFNTNFTSLYWTYAVGFPKAQSIAKSIRKKHGTESPAVEIFKGAYAGFQPKPAVEVVLVAMKPKSERTYVEQAVRNGKGISWLDDCRIPHASPDDLRKGKVGFGNHSSKSTAYQLGHRVISQGLISPNGRFPANLLTSDDVLDDEKGHESPKQYRKKQARFRTEYVGGQSKSPSLQSKEYGDAGGYSRFFSLDAWIERNLPFLIVPKASKREKNVGLEGIEKTKCRDSRKAFIDNPFQRGETLRESAHETIKPVQLMSYLVTMASREGDIVLDPFCGSGSTCIAAKLLGRQYIGIELNPKYHDIAVKRVAAA